MLNKFFATSFSILPDNNTIERIWVLAQVDFKSRYYYHRLGVLWALIRPIVELIVYYTIFNTIYQTTIDNFALYLFGGLLLWYYFSEGTKKGIDALLSKRYLIESVPFNKVYIIVAATISSFMGFCFNFLAYIFVSIFLDAPPIFPYAFQLIPIILGFTILIMGVCLILSTLSIYLKDIQHLWDMVILVGFWITPIVYDETLMIDRMPSLLYINPVAPFVITLHQAILYNETIDWVLYFQGLLIAISFLILGLILFTKFSHKAAEKL